MYQLHFWCGVFAVAVLARNLDAQNSAAMNPPPNLIIQQLDTNRDHILSFDELTLATENLMALDRDGNGQLTADEFHPRRDKLSRELVSQERVGHSDSINQYVDRLLGYDSNKDGKIGKSELPERMHRSFDQWDQNKDGAYDRQEMKSIAVAAAIQSTDLTKPRFPIERSSPPMPEKIALDALRFDSDGNGELNSSELAEFAMEYLRHLPASSRGRAGGGQSRRSGSGKQRGFNSLQRRR